MQIPRIPMLEFALVVAILGLCSALPLQCYRGVRESDYRRFNAKPCRVFHDDQATGSRSP